MVEDFPLFYTIINLPRFLGLNDGGSCNTYKLIPLSIKQEQ